MSRGSRCGGTCSSKPALRSMSHPRHHRAARRPMIFSMRSPARRSRGGFIAATHDHSRKPTVATLSDCPWRFGLESTELLFHRALIAHGDVNAVPETSLRALRFRREGRRDICVVAFWGLKPKRPRRERKEHEMTRLMLATVAGAALLAGVSAASAQTY